jgi:voltage-gated potassium channel
MDNFMPYLTAFRLTTFNILYGNTDKSKLAKYVNMFLISLIVTNIIAVIFESDPVLGKTYKNEFYYFELISITIFTIEYLARIWAAPEKAEYFEISPIKARIKYFFSPMAIIDLLAILPFFISLFIFIDLRYLRLLRVLRLLKLSHHFKGFNIFLTVIEKEIKSIMAAIMVMFFLIVIAASLMYTLESKAQPEVFGSILHSLWWSVVTMTTVGYGDVTPITTAGKVVSTFIMLVGVGLVALPAGMLAARFGEELKDRKQDLNHQIRQALEDGVIDDDELIMLEELTNKLELKPEDLERSITILQKQHKSKTCKHCGK